MIYFLRHGLDDERYIGGWSDVSLVDSGRKEILDAYLWMRNNLNIKKIISSDVLRAVESAEIIGEKLNLKVEKVPTLREQNKGIYNGLERAKLSDIDARFLRNVDIDKVYPEGESLKDLYVRINDFLNNVSKIEDDTLIVTHRGVINMIYYNLFEIPLDMDKEKFNCSHGSIHEFDKNKKMIRRIY